jgi:hypothetical protein
MNRIALLMGLLAAVSVAAPVRAGDSAVPADYQLMYHQDFEGEDPLADFVFTDASAWTLSESNGNHSLELKADSDYEPPHRSPYNIALLADKQFGSFVLEAQIQYTGRDYGHADLCLFFNFQNPGHYYYTHIGKQQDPHAHQIFIVDGEPRTAITDESKMAGFPWEQGRWEKVRVVRDAAAGTVEVYIRDMSEPILSTTDTNFQSGWLGFGTFDDRGKVDNIHVWAPKGSVKQKAMDSFESK